MVSSFDRAVSFITLSLFKSLAPTRRGSMVRVVYFFLLSLNNKPARFSLVSQTYLYEGIAVL